MEIIILNNNLCTYTLYIMVILQFYSHPHIQQFSPKTHFPQTNSNFLMQFLTNNSSFHTMKATNILTTMSTQINISDIFLMLLGLFILTCINAKLVNKGPMLWPIIGMVPSFVLHFHEMHNWTTNALEKSGGSFRIRGLFGGFEGIMTSNPINIEYILKTNFKNFPKGKYFRERFQELLGGSIFNVDDREWKEQRRIATSEMHASRFMHYSLMTMQDLVHEKLLKVIEEKVKSSKEHTIDLQELLLRFTFDNVCVAVFGVDPGYLALDLPEIPFAKAFEEATEYSLFRFLVPPYVWKTMRFFNLGKEKKLKKAVKIVHEFAETTVKNRKIDINKLRVNSGYDPCDLLSRLIRLQQSQVYTNLSNSFNDEFLRDFCISFILAGRDTTSVALVWFFWLLHENPFVENKIVHEIKEILNQRDYSSRENSHEIIFKAEELDKMVYLQGALSESLRLYPSLPFNLKQAKEDDILPDGMSIKAGHRVIYHIYAVGRNESIWGKDCSEFKPERWIKDGKFVAENQLKYLVFNAGPRLCVGKKFSYTQMKMVAASILLRYKVKVINGQNVVPKVTTTLYMKNGLFVTFQPR
ncbi:cytochrome P450 86B1-like [Silene latifolia]|uniref:cytochrome P450 86B1-like n=1 Tax=Silene latifolia TaxID=37657 RepID=UPI003D778B20